MTELEAARAGWTRCLDRWAKAEARTKILESQWKRAIKHENFCKSVAHNAMVNWVEATNKS